jgi:hypothetical protein
MTNPIAVFRTQRRLKEGLTLHREHDEDYEPDGGAVWVWCPGCEEAHRFQVIHEGVTPSQGAHWDWNGSVESPSFEPSYLTWLGPDATPTSRCHSFLRNGQWQFLSDCTHRLANQTVPMVPLPDWLVR